MKIVFIPKTHSLKQWQEVLAALAARYPEGWIVPELQREFDVVRMVLTVDNVEMSHEERQFLNSISRPTLGFQGTGISDEVYNEMRSRKWIVDSWYGLNNSIYDNK